MLAQTLVSELGIQSGLMQLAHATGRELFPGSDCLKWADRKPMLLSELAHYEGADVICLQVSQRSAVRGRFSGC